VGLTRSIDLRRFLRDLALLLGLPALAMTGFLASWHPWRGPLAGGGQYGEERRAREEGVHRTVWRGLRIETPPEYVLMIHTPVLRLVERRIPDGGLDRWPAQMAFLDLDSGAVERFADAAPNCDLEPSRCWTEMAGGHALHCQRSGGVPDPAVEWTPHLECQVPDLGIRILINAPSGPTIELLQCFRSALARRPLPPGSP
jgi:hypothetical protein